METTLKYLPDGSDYAAFVRGPVVLAAATGSDNLTGLWTNSDRMEHVADGKEYSLNDRPWLYENVAPHRLQPREKAPMTFLNANSTRFPKTADSFSTVFRVGLHFTGVSSRWYT